MLFSRKRHRTFRRKPFGLTTLVAILVPTSIGFQDLAALMARQPDVSRRWQDYVRGSAFGGMRIASFSFPRPLGTQIPDSPTYVLASFDPRTLDVSGEEPRVLTPDALPPLEFPAVNRALKGDLLVPRPRPPAPPAQTEPAETAPAFQKKREKSRDYSTLEFQSAPAALPGEPPPAAPEVAALPADPVAAPPVADAAPAAPEAAQPDIAMSLELDPEIDARILAGLPAYGGEDEGEPDAVIDVSDPATRTANLFFNSSSLGRRGETLEPWGDGAAPKVVARDPDIKLSALKPAEKADAKADGETVAGKGEVTGEGRRPKTPAERLGLSGAARAKSEKCLADAIYFESRGEPERGQMAVAQVVMNRVFSPFYPDNVCGVVYQNAHRHLACQFTFACEGKRLVVDEPDMWEQAKRIARDTLDGKLWLAEVGKSTHYHASWVRPRWVREMKRIYKFGVHTFYRPLAWGNGADEPAWGPGAKAGDDDLVTGATGLAPVANAIAMPDTSIAEARM